ncbi:PfkB family carbohydrate kinase [Oenococcus alcoholitolerans]|uniref:PfkB family carbohydrate kinase n=1 Tax=Oenococcus alcoholitolerans TaxID=931074 RepID=UPI003F70D3B2
MTEKSLIVGAAFVDIIMDVPQIPKSGDDVTANLKSYNIGGCAFNVFGAIQHYSGTGNTDLFVPVGSGQYSEMVRQAMREKNVPVIIQDNSKDNGWDLCLVEPDAERTFITVPGIEQDWSDNWFNKINLSDYKYIYVSGYEMEDQKSANLLLNHFDKRDSDATLLFDASPRISHIDKSILNRLLDHNLIVNANEDEIGYLSNADNIEGQVADIYQRTDAPVLVTLGAKGTYVYDNKGGRTIPSDHIDSVINTIGAGDTHCGGVIAGLCEGKDIDEACKIGNDLSALVIQQEAGSL